MQYQTCKAEWIDQDQMPLRISLYVKGDMKDTKVYVDLQTLNLLRDRNSTVQRVMRDRREGTLGTIEQENARILFDLPQELVGYLRLVDM